MNLKPLNCQVYIDRLKKEMGNKFKIRFPKSGFGSNDGWKRWNVQSIQVNSEKVKKHELFVAILGYKNDGHAYLEDAVNNGASILVVESQYWDEHKDQFPNTLMIAFDNTRIALALLCQLYYDDPSSKLKLIGITGTNGKTTVSCMLRSILNEAGIRTGIIGTIQYDFYRYSRKSDLTTPNALDLNKMLFEMLEQDVECVVLEVSAHALSLKRVLGLSFDGVIITNFSQDHLDFYGTFEEYFASKLQVFKLLSVSKKKKLWTIINGDLKKESPILVDRAVKYQIPYKTYGLSDESHFWANDIHFDLNSNRFLIHYQQSSDDGKTQAYCYPFELKMIGQFNVYNALAAFAAAIKMDIHPEIMIRALAKVQIPGRFQITKTPLGASVFIDYAHTSDALENMLKTIRQISPKKIITVFGCGGDREIEKRKYMGVVAAKYSDLCIITNDNPRTENSDKIIDDILVGVNQENGEYIKVVNRAEAIRKAIDFSEENDIVLIAGKGHEEYQILKDKVIYFSDIKIVSEYIQSIS